MAASLFWLQPSQPYCASSEFLLLFPFCSCFCSKLLFLQLLFLLPHSIPSWLCSPHQIRANKPDDFPFYFIFSFFCYRLRMYLSQILILDPLKQPSPLQNLMFPILDRYAPLQVSLQGVLQGALLLQLHTSHDQGQGMMRFSVQSKSEGRRILQSRHLVRK